MELALHIRNLRYVLVCILVLSPSFAWAFCFWLIFLIFAVVSASNSLLVWKHQVFIFLPWWRFYSSNVLNLDKRVDFLLFAIESFLIVIADLIIFAWYGLLVKGRRTIFAHHITILHHVWTKIKKIVLLIRPIAGLVLAHHTSMWRISKFIIKTCATLWHGVSVRHLRRFMSMEVRRIGIIWLPILS